MNNKKFRYVCLLTGICVFLASGCNFGSQEEVPETNSPAQDTQQNTEPETTEEQVTAEENIPIGAPEESEVGLVAPSIHTEDESPKFPIHPKENPLRIQSLSGRVKIPCSSTT